MRLRLTTLPNSVYYPKERQSIVAGAYLIAWWWVLQLP